MGEKTPAAGPKFVAMFGPVLEAVRALGGSARPQEVYEQVADSLGLKPGVRAEQTSSGVPRHENQMAWARFYLVRAGLLDSSKRGIWTLTEKGRDTPSPSPSQALEIFKQVRVDMAAQAKRIPPDEIFQRTSTGDEGPPADDDAASLNGGGHIARVIEILQALPPAGFERFCQRLLREAGFQNVVVTGRAGDGGIDGVGILQVNALVSFKVLFQCKRYEGSVTPSQVRDFRGAMGGRADKGIILTTGSFTAEAKKEAVRDGVPPIELVDGKKLVDMLEELEIGLVPVRAYRVDEIFFTAFSTTDSLSDPADHRETSNRSTRA
jgi:restriction system protein